MRPLQVNVNAEKCDHCWLIWWWVTRGKHKTFFLLTLNPWSAELFLQNPWKPEDFFTQFEIIFNVSVTSSRFIWIPMLWVYGHYKYFYSYSVGIYFSRRRQILTTKVYPRTVRVNSESRIYICLFCIYLLLICFISWSNHCYWEYNEYLNKDLQIFSHKLNKY